MKEKAFLIWRLIFYQANCHVIHSDGFADALANFIKPIAFADYDLPFDDLDLPKSLKKALILLNGKFTHEYEYLNEYLVD